MNEGLFQKDPGEKKEESSGFLFHIPRSPKGTQDRGEWGLYSPVPALLTFFIIRIVISFDLSLFSPVGWPHLTEISVTNYVGFSFKRDGK